MNTARRQLADAQQRADAAQRDLLAAWQPWRDIVREHRAAALLGGGFALGLGLALLPVRWWSRAGALAFRAAARTARSAWLPVLLRGPAAGKSRR